MSPAVSVIVPTYNYGRFLAAALDSVLAQTFTDWEAIVVDDGSTDNTMEVVQPYLADRRLRFHQTEHIGQPAAKNAGIRLARAPLVAFLDADDMWYPAKLERQVALFDRDPELGVAFTRRLLMDESGQQLESSWQPTFHRGRVLDELFQDNFISFSTSMVRREVFDKVGTFDERIPLAIDWDLWLRAARYFRFDYVDEPLALHRTGHANLSQRREERSRVVLTIRQRFLEEHGGRDLFSRSTIRRRFAGTKANIGYAAIQYSRARGILWYSRAILTYPGCWKAWKGLAAAFVPTPLRRTARKVLRISP